MNVEKLKKQLQREIKANPQKAAALGLLMVVALWFWAPLVWGWVAKDSSSTQKETETAVAAAPQPAAPAVNEKSTTESRPAVPKHNWETLADWMERDPLMSPARAYLGRPNPFTGTIERVAAQEETNLELNPQPTAVTPESVGLRLTSTIVGAKRRVALIDGRAYAQGQPVVVHRDGRAIEFQLAEVYPKQVVLVRESQRYLVKIEALSLTNANVARENQPLKLDTESSDKSGG